MVEFVDELERCVPGLRRYARVLTRDGEAADDLVHDCIERALPRRLLWRRTGSLRAWLFTILHNLHANHVRRAVQRPDAVPLDAVDPAVLPSQGDRMALRDMEAALARIPEDQRRTVLLVAMEGLSYRDTAQAMGVPVGTVMSRLSRGREALRALMDDTTPRPNLRRVR